MKRNENRSWLGACAAAALLVTFFASAGARADDTIKRPGDHPTYGVEIEPHLLLDWYVPYPNSDVGFGLGGRFSIPIVQNGFVPSINNSVAISFGVDWVHYGNCYYGGNCNVDYLHFPVVMQWNFFVARHWSVFGEPGVAIYHGFFGGCAVSVNGACYATPTETGIEPALFAGARYHFNDGVSLTMRIGYPTFSIGVSFFP